MSFIVPDEDKRFLAQWQLKRLSLTRGIHAFPPGLRDVTVLAYHFWNEEQNDAQFVFLECSLRETYRLCGLMKTVLVVRYVTPALESFASEFNGWVDIVVERSLVPGDIQTMSIDCISRLYTRFDTKFVLVVQNDGFPIRGGLEEFVGKWDFVGAPHVRDRWWIRIIGGLTQYWVSNGGFSLRSRHICELAAHYWQKKWFRCADPYMICEDMYYTRTLPRHEPGYVFRVNMAPSRVGFRFSYDAGLQEHGASPLGFHNAVAFKRLHDWGLISEAL